MAITRADWCNALRTLDNVIKGLERAFGMTHAVVVDAIIHSIIRPDYSRFLRRTGLRLHQSILITLYTSPLFYSQLNSSMRTNTVHPLVVPYINGLLAAMNCLPTETRSVYRGLQSMPFGFPAQTLDFPAFMSFSLLRDRAIDFYSPAGVFMENISMVGGKYIAPISNFPNEQEVLFPPMATVGYRLVVRRGIRTILLQ